MSIFDTIGGFFSGAVNSVVDLAKKVWNAIKSVWSFLVHIGGILNGAWDWMVNGVTWFTSQLTDWAANVFTTLWHTITTAIPGAAAWAFRQATRWAAKVINGVEGFLKGLVKNVASWATRAIHTLTHTARVWVNDVIRWVTGPIRWVLTTGAHIANLVLHPKALAEWLVGALVVPLVKWMLKAGGGVIAWALKLLVRDGSEFAHLIEDVIHRVL